MRKKCAGCLKSITVLKGHEWLMRAAQKDMAIVCHLVLPYFNTSKSCNRLTFLNGPFLYLLKKSMQEEEHETIIFVQKMNPRPYGIPNHNI